MSTPSEKPETPTEPTSSEPSGPSGPTKGSESGKRDSTAKPENPLRGSRTSGVWVGTVGLGLLLVLLVVFIAQNTDTTMVRFLSFEGEAPVAVALLIAVAAGILLTATAGSLRILQLRRRTRKVTRG